MPSRAARKRFASMSSPAGGSSAAPSGRSNSRSASDWTRAARAPTSSTVGLGVHDADLDRAVTRLQPGVPPQQGGVRDGPRAQERVDHPDPVGVSAKGAWQAGARKSVEKGGARRREARRPTLPERGVRRQPEQERQVDAQPVQEPDRSVRAGDPDVDVCGEGRLAPGEHPHRRVDLAVARVRRDDRVAPHRRRVHAGDAGAEPVPGQRMRELAAQFGQLRDRIADPAMDPGGDLHHGCVGLLRHAIAKPGPQARDHLVRAEGQRPVARVEEHELLLDPDGERAGWRVRPPCRPRWEDRHRPSLAARPRRVNRVVPLNFAPVPRACHGRGGSHAASRRFTALLRALADEARAAAQRAEDPGLPGPP